MSRQLGPYQIHSELGRGAMAVVWRAHDSVLEREVAVKEPLLPKGVDAVVAVEFGARFVREAKAAARLNHPNIVTIHAADIYDGQPAIIMELIEGETLGQMLERGPLEPRLALSVLEQLLSAVGYAHERGIVHRDIKPDNIFLTHDGRVKLADFGIASLASDSTLTQAGTIMGTPGYMAPEQITGEPADARADIFSIGVLAYEMLTGNNPFGASEGAPTTTIMYRIVHQAPPEMPAAALVGLSVDMRKILQVALAKNPADRFPDAASFLATLKGQEFSPVLQAGGLSTGGVGHMGGTILGRFAAIKSATMLSRSPGKKQEATWLRSWVPYAAVMGVGLIVIIALLASSRTGAGGAAMVYETTTTQAQAISIETTTSEDISALATLSASGEYFPGGSNPPYYVENLIDNDPNTCWAVHAVRSGAWVEFAFPKTVTVTELHIIAGYQKADSLLDRWPTNNRIRGYRIEFSDGTSASGEVLDERGYQTITVPPTRTTSVRLVVLSVYPYQKMGKWGWDDTSISELHPWGYE